MRRFRQLALAGALALVAGTTVACTDGDNDRRYGWNDDRRYGWDDRDWRDRRRRDDDGRRYGWYERGDRAERRLERRYEHRQDDGISGNADRMNDRLCNNGIRGDAPDDC
jgi:hypothetical protein